LSLVAIGVGLLLPVVFKIRGAVIRQKVGRRVKQHLQGTAMQVRRIAWEGSSRAQVELVGSPRSRGEVEQDVAVVIRELFGCGLPVQEVRVLIHRDSPPGVLYEVNVTGEGANWMVSVPAEQAGGRSP
jgi:hypothetical protein